MRDNQLQLYQNWMAYSPLIYNYLSVHKPGYFSQISDVKWVRGVKQKISTFRMKQNIVCIAGSKSVKSSNSIIQRGFLATFDLKIPDIKELDDTRLVPSLKIKNSWQSKSPIRMVQQMALDTSNQYFYNCFAITFQHNNDIGILNSKNLLLEQDSTQKVQDNPKLVGHLDKVTAICWANTNTQQVRLASSSLDKDKSVILWDIQKLKQKQCYEYHRSGVQDLCFLYDKEGYQWIDSHKMKQTFRIASAGRDGYVYIWDSRQKVPTGKINCRQKQVYSIASISNDAFLTGGGDGSIKFWDLKNQKQFNYSHKQKSQTHTSRVTKINIHSRQADKQNQINRNSFENKYMNIAGKIAFSSAGSDGRIIIWQDKVHFVHQGHQNQVVGYDRLQGGDGFYVSAQKNGQNIMIWQNGVTLGQIQL